MAASSLPVVIITLTQFTTVPAPTGGDSSTIHSDVHPSLSSSRPTVIISSKPIGSGSQTAISAISTLTPLPTSSPTTEPASKFLDDVTAKLTLAAVVLIIILYLLAIIYAIYLCCRGRCKSCIDKDKKIRGLEKGTYPNITIDAFKVAKKRRSQISTTIADQETRAEGMGNKDRATFWPDMFSRNTTKSLSPDPEKGDLRVENDRFFTISSPETPPLPQHEPCASLPAPQAPEEPTPRHLNRFSFEQAPRRPGYRDTQGVFHSIIEPYDGAPDAYRNLYQSEWPHSDSSHAESSEGPKPMEVIPAGDPDAEAYRMAAAAAANPKNPDRDAAQQYAERLLQRIRERSKRKGGFSETSPAERFEDIDLEGAREEKDAGWKAKAREIWKGKR